MNEEDSELDAVLQGVVVGITGLDGTMVRPRWQAVVPKQPDPDETWCAIGVMEIAPDDNAAIEHDPTGDGSDNFTRHESLSVLASFYGPESGANAAVLRDGLAIRQNNEVLSAAGIAFVATGPIRTVPDFVNQQWIQRKDLSIQLRRKVTRVYPIKSLLYGDIRLFDDIPSIDATIVVPPGSTLEP